MRLPCDNVEDVFIDLTTKGKGATGFLDGGIKLGPRDTIFLNFNILIKFKNVIAAIYITTVKNKDTLMCDFSKTKQEVKFRIIDSAGNKAMYNSMFEGKELIILPHSNLDLKSAVIEQMIKNIESKPHNQKDIEDISRILSSVVFDSHFDLDMPKFWRAYEPFFIAKKEKLALNQTIQEVKIEPKNKIKNKSKV